MDQTGRRLPSDLKGKKAMGQWLTRLKGWVAISEPSTQALRQHKKHVFRTEGVSRNDPDASLKLQVSPSTIPDDAIKPGGLGPDPEDLARKRAEERRAKRQTRSTQSSASPSMRSQSVSSSAINAQREVEFRVPPRSPESSNYRV